MELESENTKAQSDVSEADILALFADDQARGEFIILSAGENSYIQATGEGDEAYAMEYHDPNSGKHYQATVDLSKRKVQEAFLDYFRGGSAWRSDFRWKEIDVKGGCLSVIVVGLLISAGLLARGLA